MKAVFNNGNIFPVALTLKVFKIITVQGRLLEIRSASGLGLVIASESLCGEHSNLKDGPSPLLPSPASACTPQVAVAA